jgi:anti-sigma-K factor RskA
LGRSGVAALAAAAALVVGVAGGVLVADGRDGGAPSAEQAFRSAARAPGAHAMALASAEPGREAVPVVVLPDGTGYLQGDALAALPATDTYQLWAVTRAGSVVSVGVLGSRPRMQTFAVGEMPTALVITHERNPAGVERSAEPALYSATV